MKILFKIIRNWKFRRLYFRLFKLYSKKELSADMAGSQAAIAFQWITGCEWDKIIAKKV